jgi:hypothetical protein
MRESGRAKSHGRIASLVGALVFLGVVSLIIFCASVASWAPFSYLAYQEQTCYVHSVQSVACGTDQEANLFLVSYLPTNETNGSAVPLYASVVNVYRVAESFNDSATQRDLYSVNVTDPVICFGPPVPVGMTEGNLTCSAVQTLIYPTSAAVYLDFPQASQSATTWLGLWVTFVVIFGLCVPVVLYFAIRKYGLLSKEDGPDYEVK